MFKNKLRGILADRGSSMRQLSEETGITYSQINDFANLRRKSINKNVWQQVGEHLGIDPTALIVWIPDETHE